ncbi:MAG: dephospho-CoA kinase [Bacteroidota bacterium]|nr:dephospho-CoA kinase [Bacteroidota bacterium]
MIKVGLTGNIGSGKSTVARIFKSMDVPVFVADEESKKLMVSNPELILKIKELLGEKAYLSSGGLDRSYIANIVFNDALMLEKLNQIVHPAIENYYIEWCKQYTTEKYTIKEAAILFESGTYKTCDKIITVACDTETAIKRAVARDGKNTASIKARLNNQMPQEKKISLSHYVIWNNEGDEVLPKVMEIHKALSVQ